LVWEDVSKVNIDYNASNYRFVNTGALITDDGYGSIAENEITLCKDEILQHEIKLTSNMTIIIR
jgi:hypothetical protein